MYKRNPLTIQSVQMKWYADDDSMVLVNLFT